MSKNNPLRDAVRKNCNYKLYKAKKQWIYACATFLLTFGVGALASETGHAQTVENQAIGESMQSAPSSTTVVLKSKASSANSKTISSSQAGSEQDRAVAGVEKDTAIAEDGLTKLTSAPSARDIVQQTATITDPSGHGQDATLASQPVSQSNRVALTKQLVDDAQDTVMHFTVVVHDDTTGQDLYSYEWRDPQNGSYSDISGGFQAQTGHAANLYQSVSVDGEPAGVDWNDAETSPNVLASNYWQAFSHPGTSWWLPNYRWDDDDRSVMMGRTFTIHVVHKLSDISVTGEETTKIYDGHDGQLPQEATLTGTDQVTGQQITLRLTDKNWQWVTSDHQAPVNVGTYSLGIKQTSMKYGIAAVNTDRLKYTISPASRIVVHYRDVDGQSKPAGCWNSNSGSPIDDQTRNFTGQAGTDPDLTNGWDYAAAHYQLAGENGITHFLNSGNKSSDGNYYEGNYYIYLTHQTQQVDGADPTTIPAGKTAVALGLLKTVSRTINDQLPSGLKKINQTATFTRTGSYDWVTDQLVPNSTSEWKVKGNNDTAYTPTIADPRYYDITVTDGDGNTLQLANNTIPALRISDPAHQTVNINYGQKMHFKLVIHDLTTGEDVYSHDFINPVNGGYIDLKWQAGLQNPENYQVISLDGEPDGVDWEHPDKNKNFFASNYWHRFNDTNSWWIPNYRWDANNPAVMMGRTFTINVVHKLSDVSVTGEGTKVYDGQAGKLPGTATLTGTDQVTGQSVTLRLTADNLQ